MSKQSWQPYLERLKRDPHDAEALAALEHVLTHQGAESREQAVRRAGSAGRFGLKMFFGKQLFKAVQDGWDAWSAFFYGAYTPTSRSPWPEPETRDIAAAVANRFLRIGMFGVLIGFIPAILLAFQTALMIIQVWQINVQNDIVREQNGLTRQQFAVGYSTQLKEQLYATVCAPGQEGKACAPRDLPGVRADAAQGLVKLADIAHMEDRTVRPRVRLSGTQLQGTDLSGLDFAGVTFDEARFDRATLTQTDLSQSSLRRASFDQATLTQVDLSQALIVGASFTRARLSEVKLTGANLQQSRFDQTTIKGSDFSKARFYIDDKPVLRDSDHVVDWRKINLMSDVKFTEANLIKANFAGTTLLRVDFAGADLRQASFVGTKLTSGSLAGADLSGANLSNATLTDVNLTGAKLAKAQTSGLVLNNVTCPDGKAKQSKCSF